jgi:transcriptional regulator with XRE-family HTH domain
MGRSRRPKPIYLASKLKQIRVRMNLSQEKIVERLNYDKSPLVASQISEFENDKREPPVQLLLAYARMACIPMEYLVDDELPLPETFGNSSL